MTDYHTTFKTHKILLTLFLIIGNINLFWPCNIMWQFFFFFHLMFRSSPSYPPLFANEIRNKSTAFLPRCRRSFQNSSVTNLPYQDLWDLLTWSTSWLFLPLWSGLLLIFTAFPCCLSPLKTPNPHVFSYFYHLLQLAVHLRLIHLTMPKVTDALRNDHTVEWTKDNITSRNSGRNTTSTLRHGYLGRHSTINFSQVKKTPNNNCGGKRIWHNYKPKKSILSIVSCS